MQFGPVLMYTLLLGATVLRTDSASKLRCPEQPEGYNFAKLIYNV